MTTMQANLGIFRHDEPGHAPTFLDKPTVPVGHRVAVTYPRATEGAWYGTVSGYVHRDYDGACTGQAYVMCSGVCVDHLADMIGKEILVGVEMISTL